MNSTKLFGTDGIRARAGEFPLNSPAIAAIGRAIGEKLVGKIFIGQDTRMSSPWIFQLLRQGLSQTSAAATDAGVIPTPAIALLTKSLGYSGGVMISASHNAYEDNGIKVFGADGTKLNDSDEAQVEKRIFELLGSDAQKHTDDAPQTAVSASNTTGWLERYQEILLSHFPKRNWLAGVRIVLDCANGAMSEIAPRLLKKLGADVVVTHASPDGTNINAGCGAVHVEALQAEMSAANASPTGHSHQQMKNAPADFGVAFDGDGDYMYVPTAIWTAVHHHIPLLLFVLNNGGYIGEGGHQVYTAEQRERSKEHLDIAIEIKNPNIDIAGLARAQGAYAEGPIEDPNELEPAIQRGFKAMKEQSTIAVLDVKVE